MHLNACQYSKRYVRLDNWLYSRVHPLARARVRARIGSRELDSLFQAREDQGIFANRDRKRILARHVEDALGRVGRSHTAGFEGFNGFDRILKEGRVVGILEIAKHWVLRLTDEV